MRKANTPEGYHTITPYLIIPEANKFLEFVKEVFGAEEKMKVIKEGTKDKIMHAEILIGDSLIMLGNSGNQWLPRPGSLFIYVENGDETYHKAISRGAKSILPMEDKEYGRTGGVEDPNGNVWWITSIQNR